MSEEMIDLKELDMTIIEKTIRNLKKNNMCGYFCETSKDAVELVKTLINEGDTIASGGSISLAESGVLDLLKSGKYNYLDRSLAKTPEEIEKVYEGAYSADAYFMSSNAITKHGALYNVDGNSNRVSALLYGPKSVIIIAGYNKIVDDLNEAVLRVKKEAAPKNTKRLNCETYCKHEEECLACGADAAFMCDGCRTPDRICCNYVISAQQRNKNRIKVILVGEKLGY